MDCRKSGPEIYTFQLVEFISRGRKTMRDIDIVPSRWIDTKNGKTTVSKFMPPPYTAENEELLHSLVKADSDPPQSWPTFSVKIRGQAKTYNEAVHKLKKLETVPFAFTTDSETDPLTKGTEIEKKIIRAKKYTISEETQNAMLVPSMASKFPDDLSDVQKKYNTGDETDSSSSSDEKTKKGRKSKPKFATEPACHVLPKKKLTPNSPTLPGDKIRKVKSLMVRNEIQKEKSSERETDKPGIEKNTKYRKDDSALILANLKGLAIDLKEVMTTQNAILRQLNRTGGGDHVIEKKFAETYKLRLPFQSQEEFAKFNEQLGIDDEFRAKFISSLDSLFDRELMLGKSLTNICKKYLSRNVAVKYTVLRKVPGKSLLKETLFYDAVLGVIIQTHKDPLTTKKVSEQLVDVALGRVMNNAKDWNGQRQKRAPPRVTAADGNHIHDRNENAARESSPSQRPSDDGESTRHVESDEESNDAD